MNFENKTTMMTINWALYEILSILSVPLWCVLQLLRNKYCWLKAKLVFILFVYSRSLTSFNYKGKARHGFPSPAFYYKGKSRHGIPGKLLIPVTVMFDLWHWQSVSVPDLYRGKVHLCESGNVPKLQ